MSQTALLPARAVLSVTGPDRVAFLQGLVSNDVTQAAPGRAVWAALLSPQGKWLADFFILADGERLLLDCEAAGAEALAQRLSRYRLRAKVAVAADPLAVYAVWDGAPVDAPIAAPDPRLGTAGWRVLAEGGRTANASAADYDRHRLSLGLPDGGRDMEADKSVLLEGGFDLLHGVSWTKGCYMGQELTARTKYRGLLKRRLYPVRLAGGGWPGAATPVLRDGVEVGQLRSGDAISGLALLRTDAVGGAMSCAGQALSVDILPWMQPVDGAVMTP